MAWLDPSREEPPAPSPPAPRSSAHEPGEPGGHGASGHGRAGRPRLTGDYSRANLLRLLAVGAGTGGGLALFLDVMFRLHGEAAPAGLDAAALIGAPALAVGVVALFAWDGPLSTAGRRRGQLHGRRLNRRQLQRSREDFQRAYRQRLADLASDPVNARYVPLIEAGESWSDDQIGYDVDRASRTTCQHLRPVEDALRASTIPVKLQIPHWIEAKAVCDHPALEHRFGRSRDVVYDEGYVSDRGSDYEAYATLRCMACQSRITFVHPDEARHGEPRFP